MSDPKEQPANAVGSDSQETAVGAAAGSDAKSTKRMPGALIVAPVAYLVLLVLAAWLLHGMRPFDVLGVSIPVDALWFGMLGGVIASLQGMFFYNARWDHSYDLWHIFSGIIGAAYGLVSFLFLVVIMKAGASNVVDLTAPVFALGAFALGYGQRHFNAMIEKVFNVLFSEPKKKDDAS